MTELLNLPNKFPQNLAKMKILIPVLGFGKAGGYRVLSKLANELIRLGHSVEFLCTDNSKNPYFPTLASIKWIDKKGRITINKNKTNKKENAFSIQKKLTKALSKMPKDEYDVIIANHSLTTLPIKRAGLIHKTIYYVQAYEPDLYILSGGLKNEIISYLSSLSYKMKLFTVVNAEKYLKYKSLTASKVLYPGIDFNLFYPKDEKLLNQNKEKIIIGTVGRSEIYKGTRYIVEAFKKLKKKYSSIQLYVAFGNPADFKDEDDIFCYQPDGDEALGNFYRSLDYYFCAGYTQLGAFHYPVVEAMSCGVPVITTHYYPANSSNSWIVAPNNFEKLVEGFEMAQSDPYLKEKKIQQALIDVKQFEWASIGQRLNDYIQEFINTQSLMKF